MLSKDYSRFTSVSSLLKDLNWAPLRDRRRDIRLAMLFKIVKCNMPVQADAVLLPADPRTRSHHRLKFKHIQSHTAQYKHSFFVRTVPEWNSLSEACVNADTVTAFQTQLHHTTLSGAHSHRRDTRKWSDDYRSRTRTRILIVGDDITCLPCCYYSLKC